MSVLKTTLDSLKGTSHYDNLLDRVCNRICLIDGITDKEAGPKVGDNLGSEMFGGSEEKGGKESGKKSKGRIQVSWKDKGLFNDDEQADRETGAVFKIENENAVSGSLKFVRWATKEELIASNVNPNLLSKLETPTGNIKEELEKETSLGGFATRLARFKSGDSKKTVNSNPDRWIVLKSKKTQRQHWTDFRKGKRVSAEVTPMGSDTLTGIAPSATA